jgi:hypothetical protein
MKEMEVNIEQIEQDNLTLSPRSLYPELVRV